MSDCRVTLLPVDGENAPLRDVLGGIYAATGRVLNLHRALGHAPALLQAVSQLALALRGGHGMARSLREFVILRIAQLSGSEYELAQHLPMARASGITEAQLQTLAEWRCNPPPYGAAVGAALAYTQELFASQVSDATFDALRQHFDEAQVVELTLTASFYVMVALTTGALRLPLEAAAPPR